MMGVVINFTRALCSITILAAAVGSVPARANDGSERAMRVVAKDGWEVPGLKGSHVASAPKELSGDVHGSYVELTPSPAFRRPRELTFYSKGRDCGDVLVTKRAVKVTSIRSYQIGEKAFCYEVTVVRYHFDPGVGGGYGSETSLFYFDEDGDGTFETLIQGFPPDVWHVPSWAVGGK